LLYYVCSRVGLRYFLWESYNQTYNSVRIIRMHILDCQLRFRRCFN